MSEIADAVTGTVGDLFGDQTEDAAQPEAEQAAAPEAEVEVEELPDWEAASRDLFTEDEEDEPDFNALADEELGVAETEDLAPNEYDDEQTAKLKREALAAKKRAEHYERLHLRTARKNWEAEVKAQPWGEFVGDLSTIKATSHRDFLRQAKASAKKNYEVLKPHYDRLKTERERLTTLAKQEAQAEVQTAWGKPTVGAGAQVPASAEQRVADGLTDARRSRSIFKATKALIDEGII